MSDINKEIEHRVSTFVSELTALIRQAAVDAVADVLGGAAKRGPGRPRGTTSAPAGKGARAAVVISSGGRRTPEQIEATLVAVLDYIKSHPNAKSEAIRAALKLPKPVAHDTLMRLRESKKIKMKGIRRGASYSAT